MRNWAGWLRGLAFGLLVPALVQCPAEAQEFPFEETGFPPLGAIVTMERSGDWASFCAVKWGKLTCAASTASAPVNDRGDLVRLTITGFDPLEGHAEVYLLTTLPVLTGVEQRLAMGSGHLKLAFKPEEAGARMAVTGVTNAAALIETLAGESRFTMRLDLEDGGQVDVAFSLRGSRKALETYLMLQEQAFDLNGDLPQHPELEIPAGPSWLTRDLGKFTSARDVLSIFQCLSRRSQKDLRQLGCSMLLDRIGDDPVARLAVALQAAELELDDRHVIEAQELIDIALELDPAYPPTLGLHARALGLRGLQSEAQERFAIAVAAMEMVSPEVELARWRWMLYADMAEDLVFGDDLRQICLGALADGWQGFREDEAGVFAVTSAQSQGMDHTDCVDALDGFLADWYEARAMSSPDLCKAMKEIEWNDEDAPEYITLTQAANERFLTRDACKAFLETGEPPDLTLPEEFAIRFLRPRLQDERPGDPGPVVGDAATDASDSAAEASPATEVSSEAASQLLAMVEDWLNRPGGAEPDAELVRAALALSQTLGEADAGARAAAYQALLDLAGQRPDLADIIAAAPERAAKRLVIGTAVLFDFAAANLRHAEAGRIAAALDLDQAVAKGEVAAETALTQLERLLTELGLDAAYSTALAEKCTNGEAEACR